MLRSRTTALDKAAVCTEADTTVLVSCSTLPPAGDSRPTVARNVLANWAGHFVLVVSGFIMPRLINDHLGQEQLGVWDFGWSTISYLGLLTAGITSSVNRYVARHRAMGDSDALNGSTSACMCIFAITGTLAAILTALVVTLLPRILPASFAPHLSEARFVLAFFGLSTALSMPVSVYHGVITGCQRYDLAMYVETGSFLGLFVGVLMALILGFGLRSMAAMVLGAKIFEAAAKLCVAHRVCPELRISIRRATRRAIAEQLAFGGKTYLAQIGSICLYQGNSMLIAFCLGPASLAVYSRAMALVGHANKLLFEFGRVLVPAVSAAQVSADKTALASLVFQASRYSAMIAFPVVLVLTVLGEPLMRIWMGSAYAGLPLLQVLAIGHLACLSQTGSYCALLGMNRHGLPAMAIVIAAAASLLMSWVCIHVLHAGVMGVAVSVAVSLTLVNLVFIPIVVSRACHLSVMRYYARTLSVAWMSIPFAACLVAGRYVFAASDYKTVLFGFATGWVILAGTYWRFALPDWVKHSINRRARGLVFWGVTES